MKMPARINDNLLAPCGLNCRLCYRNLKTTNPCPGCLVEDDVAGDSKRHPGKTKTCRDCAIKACVQTRGRVHCRECGEAPCQLLKRLEKSYRRYGLSLTANRVAVGRDGLEAFMAAERIRWACPECGGVICLHNQRCSECGLALKAGDDESPIYNRDPEPKDRPV